MKCLERARPTGPRGLLVLIAALLFALVPAGCNGGGDDTGHTGDTAAPTATLDVHVFDLEGVPVEGAGVTVGGEAQTTSASGTATFEGLATGRVVAQVHAAGFAPTTAVVDLPDGAATTSVRLLRSIESVPFDPTTPSDLYAGPVHLEVGANVLVDASGNPVSEDVVALITPLDPSTEQAAAFPGPLQGVLEGDTEPTPFESVLMADVRLQTADDGERVFIAEGETVGLEFLLPESLQDDYSSGDAINAYAYDPDQGVWIQEGQGTVGDATYGGDRLSWQVDVEHFTWWNCDEPWTDKNCVTVSVIDGDDGDPLGGVGIDVQGVSYNGVTQGTTDASGNTCVDFKLGSDAQVVADLPLGYTLVGGPVSITGTSTPATCAGQGGGTCEQVDLVAAPPTCVSGTVDDPGGSPVDGAEIHLTYQVDGQAQSTFATTDANGEYCVDAPRDAQVTVQAVATIGGEAFLGETSASTSAAAGTCGDDTCDTVPTITVEEHDLGCVEGQVDVIGTGAGSAPAPATRVYIYEGTRQADVDIDCSAPPEDWGTLLAQGMTRSDGSYCIPTPLVDGHQITAVAGRCGSLGAECPSFEDVGATVAASQVDATCGSADCVELGDLSVRECGTGP